MRSLCFLIVVVLMFVSCAKNFSDKEQSPIRNTAASPEGASGMTSVTPETEDSSQGAAERMPSASEVPIGELPQLHSSVLAQFHPNPKGFFRYKSLAIDTTGMTQSVAFFRQNDDTTHTLRCIIIDEDERVASVLIKEMAEIKMKGYRDSYRDGENTRAYYTSINGTPAIKAYIPSKTVATLTILCGDHRVVALREYRVSSADHLIEVAKTMNLARLEQLVP